MNRVNRYFKSTIEYVKNSEHVTGVFYIFDNSNTHTRKVVTEKGEDPVCFGDELYCDSFAAVLRIHSEHASNYHVNTEEIKWKDLPTYIQQVFDYKKYRKEHPLKLYQYPEDSHIRIWRAKIPERIDEQTWLEMRSQPFDLILEDPVIQDHAILVPPKACPICGSRNVSSTGFNELEPYALAGSAGYTDTCNDCGYSHREITVMS